MKTTRIEVEGAKGKAAIRREVDEVVIEATVGRKTTTWRFFSRIHEVWEKCREVERALGRDLDGLEGIVQDMAAGVDDAESIDVDYVRDALNAQLEDVVAEADACPECGERGVDNLVWQDDGKVKCSTCGKQYEPPTK